MAIQLKRYTADSRASAATSNSKRWESEFAHETWAIDLLDMLPLAEFEKLLRTTRSGLCAGTKPRAGGAQPVSPSSQRLDPAGGQALHGPEQWQGRCDCLPAGL